MADSSYLRVALTADVALFCGAVDDLCILLIRRGRPPFQGMWALPGGFVDKGERVEAAARRELAEETGVVWDGPLSQVGGFGDPGRDPRGRTVSVVYWAHVGMTRLEFSAGDDAEYADWHRIDELPELAFDHSHIVGAALHRMKECVG